VPTSFGGIFGGARLGTFSKELCNFLTLSVPFSILIFLFKKGWIARGFDNYGGCLSRVGGGGEKNKGGITSVMGLCCGVKKGVCVCIGGGVGWGGVGVPVKAYYIVRECIMSTLNGGAITNKN
jgi:hypothetical protein